MQNRCETQFKIKKIHFQKLTYLLENRKSTKGIEKKTKWTFQYERFFWFEKVEKHETGDAVDVERRQKNKKRREDKKTLNQMENGTRKTCVRKIKTRGKRKTQREQSEKTKKRRRTNEEKCKEEEQKPEQMSKTFFFKKKGEEEKKKNDKVRQKGRVSKGSNEKPSFSKKE